MVDILLLQTVSIAIASASVVAGVVYYALQLRHQGRMRQTDLVMRLYSTYDSLEFLEAWNRIFFTENGDYDAFLKKLGGKRHTVSFVCMFYEEVGVLLHKKLIDIDLVDELLGDSIQLTWEKLKNMLEEARKRYRPEAYVHFEYLYNEMKKREQKLQQSTVKGV
jgi:hypothetical protein